MAPSLRVDQLADYPPAEWGAGAVLRLGGSHSVLRSDATSESVASLLGALQPLGEREALLWRVVLAPAARPQLPEPATREQRQPGLLGLVGGSRPPRPDHLRALRLKYSGPVVSAVIVVAVQAGHKKRSAHLISRLASVARSRRGGYGGLVIRRRGQCQLGRLLVRRTLRDGNLVFPFGVGPDSGSACGRSTGCGTRSGDCSRVDAFRGPFRPRAGCWLLRPGRGVIARWPSLWWEGLATASLQGRVVWASHRSRWGSSSRTWKPDAACCW